MTPIDNLLGANLKRLRMLKEFTQEQIAERCTPPVNGAQIAKYESGDDRMTGARIYDLANILGCVVGALFDGAHQLAMNRRLIVTLPNGKEMLITVEPLGNLKIDTPQKKSYMLALVAGTNRHITTGTK